MTGERSTNTCLCTTFHVHPPFVFLFCILLGVCFSFLPSSRTTCSQCTFWSGLWLCDNISSCCDAYCKCAMLLTISTMKKRKSHGFTLRQNGWRATWHLRLSGCNISQSAVIACYFPLHKAQNPPCTKQHSLCEKLKVPSQVTVKQKLTTDSIKKITSHNLPVLLWKAALCANK